jgi:NADPH:quinone reductase
MSRDELLGRAKDLFSAVIRGAVHITIGQRFPLAEAAQAHRDLEARVTSASTILLP